MSTTEAVASMPAIRLVDYLTLLALVLGPVLAIGIQLWFEQRREDRKRKTRVLDALMANRARIVSLEFVQALNVIDVVWYDHFDVREKWNKLFHEFEHGRGQSGPELEQIAQRRYDLIVELISLMAKHLGYVFDHTLLKDQRYNPQAAADEDAYQAAIRRALLPLLSGERSLSVKLTGEQASSANEPMIPPSLMPPLRSEDSPR